MFPSRTKAIRPLLPGKVADAGPMASVRVSPAQRATSTERTPARRTATSGPPSSDRGPVGPWGGRTPLALTAVTVKVHAGHGPGSTGLARSHYFVTKDLRPPSLVRFGTLVLRTPGPRPYGRVPGPGRSSGSPGPSASLLGGSHA